MNALESLQTSPKMPDSGALDIWRPLCPTTVLNTYWRFASERQRIFFRKAAGDAPPWTTDPILQTHRFTNAYRASDRVSQFLIQNILYPNGETDRFGATDVVFRTLLFKIFNRIETWRALENALGELTWRRYDFEAYDTLLTCLLSKNVPIFSAAYRMPGGVTMFRDARKHRNWLRLLEMMLRDDVVGQLQRASSLRAVYETLRGYPMLGPFLAFQFAIDLNYGNVIDFSENSFVVAGPGAKSGIRKCFANSCGLSDEAVIALMIERQNEEFSRLDLSFSDLCGRPLHLVDCQNLFCETDKYARVAHPQIVGIGDRTRIKQKYKPTFATVEPQQIVYRYPPKWNLPMFPANAV